MRLAFSFLCMVVLQFSPADANQASRRWDVTRHGAVGNGESLDTDAIQQAIDECAKSGGGTVAIPPGRYLTSTIYLANGVNLHLEQGARLVGSPKQETYGGFQKSDWGKLRWNRGLIIGENLSNVSINGPGVIDGNRVRDSKGEAGMRGPHTVLLSNCTGFELRETRIVDSGNYAFFFYACRDVTIRDASFQGGWDGIHFRGKTGAWNENVLVADCRFETGDDSLAGHYIRDATFERCDVNSSCNGLRLIGPAERLTIRDCDFHGPGRLPHLTPQDLNRTNMLAGILLQPSAWGETPGPMTDVCIENVRMRQVACAIAAVIRPPNHAMRLKVDGLRAEQVYGPALSVESWGTRSFDDVSISNVAIQYDINSVIDPRKGGPVQVQKPVRMPGVGIWNRHLPSWGLYARKVHGLRLEKIELINSDENDVRPAIILVDVNEFEQHSLRSSQRRNDVPLIIRE